ncbi:MAG: ABC transporter permease [Lentisphaeria bacterium]|nr:ABC transporter permease [Lentisphaeria bacterium]
MENSEKYSFFHDLYRRFGKSAVAWCGVAGIIFLSIPAIFAPFIANGRPLLMISSDGVWSMPFLHSFFAPESSEVLVEKLFNFLALYLPVAVVLKRLCRRKKLRRILLAVTALLIAAGFFAGVPVMDKQNYRQLAGKERFALFAAIPYGPDEIVGEPYEAPGRRHILGCDDIGRDLAARVIYGSRVSLAVGVLAATVAMAIGLTVGMSAGYFRGKMDLLLMRLVEIMQCFPTFLLLLILMSLLGDYQIAQSIPLVILVIGCTGWIGVAFLVRGEVLKESSLAYVKSCVVSGVSPWKIMFKHLLPNISGTVLISFTFGVAGAILSESSLSFLGFGVQPPTASWGNLMRQAFDNPMAYWHLTFFPGMMLFIAVMSFNFTGDALRRAFDVKED